MLNKLREEAAQGLTAYALLLLFVALVLILIVTVLGEELYALYEYIIDYLSTAFS